MRGGEHIGVGDVTEVGAGKRLGSAGTLAPATAIGGIVGAILATRRVGSFRFAPRCASFG
jgi:hypothetical protein